MLCVNRSLCALHRLYIFYRLYTSMSKARKIDSECSNCGIPKSQHFFGRMDRRCPGPEEGDRPLKMPSVHPLEEDEDDEDLSKQMAEKHSSKPPPSPPPGLRKVKREYWEAVDPNKKRPAVNKHTGVYAYHADDCMCGMGGWPCFRDGAIWSCCGQTEKYCMCPGRKNKK